MTPADTAPAGSGADSGTTPPRDDAAAQGSDGFVQSLARGLAVIAAFDAEHPSMTLSETARRASMSRAAARRFLRTLEQLGYVRSDGRAFALTPQVMRLGFAYLSSQTLPDVAQPHLRALAEQVHESTSVAVLDGDDIVYVARRATRRIMNVAIGVGTRFPAYATSMGRVLLAGFTDAELDTFLARAPLERLTPSTMHQPTQLRAEIERVRQQGYAVVDQELELGLRSLAVPIHDGQGAVIAAANISTSVAAAPATEVESLLAPLRTTAGAIEADLRSQGR